MRKMNKPRSDIKPFLFAYDISDSRRGKQALKILQRWRINGQLSLHESLVRQAQVHEITAELLQEIHPQQDKLLIAELSQKKTGAVLHLVKGHRSLGAISHHVVDRLPARLANGRYLIAYDVGEPRQLQRVQRLVAKHCIALQKSLYLFDGGGADLYQLITTMQSMMTHSRDDLRIYIPSNRPIWALSSEVSGISGLSVQRPVSDGSLFWSRFKAWLGRRS